jgi:hypothetical protein
MIDWNKELDKVDEATRPIAEGEHTFKIIDAQATVSSTGNRMIRTTVKVEEPDPDAGKTAIVNLVFTFDNPRGMKMTIRRLKNIGVSEESLKAENLTIEQIADRIKGQVAQGKVAHREWNGEMQNDVDFVKSGVSGVPSSPLPTTTATPSSPTTPPAPPTPPSPTPTPTLDPTPPSPQLPLDGDPDEPF